MMKLKWLALAGAAALLAGNASAQQAAPPARDFSKVEMKTTDLGNKTYMLEGDGGNITVAIGADGIIMVDGEFAPLHDKIKAAVEAVSKEPIKFLVNTHFHGDHSGGNAPFAKDGAVVTAQLNVGKRLEAGTTNGLTGAKTPPVAPAALPTKTYFGGTVLRVKGRVASLIHIPHAHTDGDTFTNGRYPNIDFANGGNIRGMIAAAEAYLRIANDKTKIVPGHGPLADRAKLIEYRAMLITARDRMAKLIKEGKTEDDVIAAKPFADIDAKLGTNEQASKNWIRVVYNSLKKPS